MSNFRHKPGHVVYCSFPQEDNPEIIQDRPALVLDCFEQGGDRLYRVAKMTKTNNSHKFKGMWIEKESKEGKSMRLSYDTFIHLERIIVIPEYGIRRLMGFCTCFEEILKIWKGNE